VLWAANDLTGHSFADWNFPCNFKRNIKPADKHLLFKSLQGTDRRYALTNGK
jgi:hypothetical protein